MKAITFLGTGRYKETTYYFGDKTASPTNLFPKVLCEFFQPEEILVMVTKQAKVMWFDELKNQLKPLCLEPTPVDIPEGHKVEDLWEIFGSLTTHLNEKDEVIFDITHSFRTLPFLSFLAASYLRVAKNVIIGGIYYGAWEARSPQPPPDEPFSSSPTDLSPVFELTPFIKLLDWTTATEKFLTTGNAQGLADLLEQSHQTSWHNAPPENQQDLPYQLKNLGSTLNDLSLALALTRPKEVSRKAENLKLKLASSINELEKWPKPFVMLLEKVRESYSQFSKNDLETQRKLVGWYIERKRVTQSVTLAREWLVSVVCKLLNKDVIEGRDDAETLLNRAVQMKREGLLNNDGLLNLSDEIVQAWQSVSDLRNDLAHCGFRPQPRPSNKILKAAEALPKQLELVTINEIEEEKL